MYVCISSVNMNLLFYFNVNAFIIDQKSKYQKKKKMSKSNVFLVFNTTAGVNRCKMTL